MKQFMKAIGLSFLLACTTSMAYIIWSAYWNGISKYGYKTVVVINRFHEAHIEALVVIPIALAFGFYFFYMELREI